MRDRYKSHNYGSIDPPRRVEILRGSGAGNYFKVGQYAYAVGYDTRGGPHFADGSGTAKSGELAYLVSKTKTMRGGALWFPIDAVRFTQRG